MIESNKNAFVMFSTYYWSFSFNSLKVAVKVSLCKNALNSFQLHVPDSSTPVVNGDGPEGAPPNDTSRTNTSHHRILVSALHCLILSLVKSNPDMSDDTKDKIVLQVFLDAHHPSLCKPFFLLNFFLILWDSSTFLGRFHTYQNWCWLSFKTK